MKKVHDNVHDKVHVISYISRAAFHVLQFHACATLSCIFVSRSFMRFDLVRQLHVLHSMPCIQRSLRLYFKYQIRAFCQPQLNVLFIRW